MKRQRKTVYAPRIHHREMTRAIHYYERQLAHCAEAIALCDRALTPKELADAEAALAVSAPALQAELNLTSP